MAKLVGNDNHDINLYYNESFLKVKIKDNWQWAFISAPAIDRVGNIHVKAWLQKQPGQIISLPKDCFDIDTGKARYYFNGNEAYWMRRLPVRDASRAITKNNTRFVNPLTSIIPSNFQSGIKRIQDTHDYLELLGGPDPQFSFEGAQRYLQNRIRSSKPCLSVPLKGESWCLSLALNSKKSYDLWYGLVKVGEIDSSNVFTPVEKCFTQEVKDWFPELQVNYNV